MSEETVNHETPSVVLEGEAPNESIEEVKSPKNIRDSLTRKAARFYDEGEYTEKEFTEMLNMYDDTMKSIEQGGIVTGTVMMLTENSVIVDIGFKSEGSINLQEFGDSPIIEVGDKIEVFLEDVENQDGQLVLSKQKADFMKVWDQIKEIYDSNREVNGRLVRRIKGGIVVDLLGVDAFLPGSQIDIRQVKNFDQYIGETYNLKIIKLNKARRNIVVSRRVVLEEARSRMRDSVLAELEIDQVREGTVKNITDFGAFIDLGGVDGLLHITDMSWGRISHPSELVSIGDKINVKVLNFEEGKTRISLGLKQLTPYPWDGVEVKYPEGAVVKGKVVSTTDYGAFVELEHGIEGLVHISEMSWTQHVKHPSRILSVGDIIQCKVLSIDKDGEKISLGIKQLEPDPWASIGERHPIGSHVEGKVRNLTNFGAFVEIEEGIDGLVHISDMSWTKRIKHPSEVMKKGELVEVVILDIDKDNRRISLGHKQIFDDPWATLEAKFAIGMITKGDIIRILDRGVVVALENNLEGFVPAFQLGQDVKKPADAFDIGDELPLKVIEFDKDQRKIVLSVREYFKERDKNEFEEFKEKYKPKPVTIGDAFGEILDSGSETDETGAAVEEKSDGSTESVEVSATENSDVSPTEVKNSESVDEEGADSTDESDTDGQKTSVAADETPEATDENVPEDAPKN
ncbi:MAG: 30S ribosomal protein S1 [Candidatus Latescibacteria bacterium]|nr:30S ribosomal protein S1 [Candidatus Latescibacterota bacterium]